MKIVIGGASSVGKSLVGYLSLGSNDIVVVDEDAAKLDEIAKEYDIRLRGLYLIRIFKKPSA